MKYIIISVFSILLIIDPGKIARINSAKTEARKAYMDGNYKKAVEKYAYLSDSLDVQEDEVMINLANSYFQINDTTNAIATYQSLTGSSKSHIRSKAQQQLGILNHRQGKLEEALNHFKQAIKADANNVDAKYNYEMLKKKLDEEKKKQEQQQNKDQRTKDQKNKDPQNKDQQKKDQENKDQKQKEKDKEDQQKKDQQNKDQQKKDQEQKDKEQKDKEAKEKKDQGKQDQEQKENTKNEKKENSPQLSQKLQEMKISEEKAKMILEAMKNQEIQYLQQNKRKATKPKDRGKPDW
jgi:Ca-activated chloride channel family protein